METNELREILKLYGLQHDVVINKSSRRYSIILDNNIIGTNHAEERVVVFRPIPEGKTHSAWSEIGSTRSLKKLLMMIKP